MRTWLLAIDANADGTPETTLPPDTVLTDPAKVQDSAMPTTTITVQGPQDGQGKYTGPVTVSLAAVDNNSGVLKTYYSLDGGGTWQVYTTAFQVSPGQAPSIQFYTIDKAGNEEYPPQVRNLSFAGESHLYLPAIIRGEQQAAVVQQAVVAPTIVEEAEVSRRSRAVSGARADGGAGCLHHHHRGRRALYLE